MIEFEIEADASAYRFRAKETIANYEETVWSSLSNEEKFVTLMSDFYNCAQMDLKESDLFHGFFDGEDQLYKTISRSFRLINDNDVKRAVKEIVLRGRSKKTSENMLASELAILASKIKIVELSNHNKDTCQALQEAAEFMRFPAFGGGTR